MEQLILSCTGIEFGQRHIVDKVNTHGLKEKSTTNTRHVEIRVTRSTWLHGSSKTVERYKIQYVATLKHAGLRTISSY